MKKRQRTRIADLAATATTRAVQPLGYDELALAAGGAMCTWTCSTTSGGGCASDRNDCVCS